MSKRSNIIIYLLGIYVVLQFLWWGYQIIDLGSLVDSSDKGSSRKSIHDSGRRSGFHHDIIGGILANSKIN